MHMGINSNFQEKKPTKNPKKLQIKFWDVLKAIHLKAAFLPHKTNKETDS